MGPRLRRARGWLGRRRHAAARGQLGRGAHRWRRVPPARRRGAHQGTVARAHDGVVLLSRAGVDPERGSGDGPQPPRRARRTHPRARAHLERRARAGLQPNARGRPGHGRALLPRHEDHLRVRQLRPVLALPPREDDRDRRPRGLRRGHRPDVRRRGPLRQPGAQGTRRCRLARHRNALARADRR